MGEHHLYRKHDVLLICLMLDVDRRWLLQQLRSLDRVTRRHTYISLLLTAARF